MTTRGRGSCLCSSAVLMLFFSYLLASAFSGMNEARRFSPGTGCSVSFCEMRGGRHEVLSSIGFWGKGRQRQELAAMIMRKCMSSLILKEKAHVLPRSIIGMETGSVKGLCPLEQSADLWISALERRHRACREQRDQSSQCSAGAGVGAAASKRDPTPSRVVSICTPQTSCSPPRPRTFTFLRPAFLLTH